MVLWAHLSRHPKRHLNLLNRSTWLISVSDRQTDHIGNNRPHPMLCVRFIFSILSLIILDYCDNYIDTARVVCGAWSM